MEPRNDLPEKGQKQEKEKKKGRFQIVRLEERIAPGKGGQSKGNGCYHYSRHFTPHVC